MNFNRKLFNTTDTELKAIAALANIGFTAVRLSGTKRPQPTEYRSHYI